MNGPCPTAGPATHRPLLAALLLSLHNLGVIGVWAFTAANEWYLYTAESVPVYSLTMCYGGPLSVAGVAAGLAGVTFGPPHRRKWWWCCVAANAAGLVVNCAGFLGPMGGGG